MSVNNSIEYEIKNNVAIISINRPPVHAFNWELMKELYDALIRADNDNQAKCILLRSTGTYIFSAGIDLKTAKPGDTNYVERMREYVRKITQTMLLMKKLIITQVQGSAIGFGMLLIMASDLRIFADRPFEEMKFGLPEVALAVYPQSGATILPLITFGVSYAKNILLTADEIGLEELKRLNIPTRIVPLENLELETRKFLRTLTKRNYSFLFLIKTSLSIMNKGFIKKCYELEDECGNLAYQKKSMEELENIVKDLYIKYA